MKRDTERKITVEDLLRFKRAERPPPEFWGKFESEMRAKQLAAIVGKRPWWVGASGIFAAIARHQVYLGAAAALALAWAGVHYVGEPVAIARSAPAKAPQPAVAVAGITAHVSPAAIPASVARVPQYEVGTAPSEAAQVQRQIAMADVPHVSQVPAVAPAQARLSFGDGISITLAGLRETPPDAARRDVFGSDREFEPAPSTENQPVSEPLARMDPSAERRARLLAPAFPAYSAGGTQAIASDWMRSRASNDRIYESMDPYGSSDRAVVGFRF
jgi:hypothetical protein